MSGSGEVPLVGVVATPRRIEAQLVNRTPFGRLMPAGRRIVEDVDGPTNFVPMSIARQIAEGAAERGANGEAGGPGAASYDGETLAGDAWIQSIANAVAKLTFGVRGPGLRVGVAIDGRLGSRGRSVLAARSGARVPDIAGSLGAALRGRNCAPSAPIGRAAELGEAWALGEIHSAIGSAGSSPRALILTWDEDVSWTVASQGRVLSNAIELPGAKLDLGFATLDQVIRGRGASAGRILASARRGEEAAIQMLQEAAIALGRGAASRLLTQARQLAGQLAQQQTEARDPTAGGRDAWVRLILAGALGRAAADHRMASAILGPFEDALVEALAADDVRAQSVESGLLLAPGEGLEEAPVTETGGENSNEWRLFPGTLLMSREDASACLGAASLALRDDTLAAHGGRSSR